MKKVGAKYIVSGFSLLLIVLLIPGVVITNLVRLPFVFVYGFLLVLFFVILAYLTKNYSFKLYGSRPNSDRLAKSNLFICEYALSSSPHIIPQRPYAL